MLLLCVAVMVIPITLCLVVYSQYSASTMEKEILRNMRVTIEQGKNNIDYRMQQVEGSALSMLTTVYPYLASDTPPAEHLQEYNELIRLVAEYKIKPMVAKLRLYVPSSKRYSSQGDTFYSLKALIPDEDDTLAARALRGVRWMEPHPIALSFGERPIQVVSCRTTITSTSDYAHIVGILYIDIDVADFGAVLSAGISENESLFLVNQSGTILCHSDTGKNGQAAFTEAEAQALSENASGTLSNRAEGRDFLTVYTRLDGADWYLVMTVPKSEAYAIGFFSLDMMRISIILIIIISFVVALAITYQMVIERTLLRINSAIEQLHSQGLTVTRQEEEASPIALVRRGNKVSALATLERNTHRMVLTIKTLLDTQYQNEIAARDYQMQALQAQINPHFLYNTLDVIKWMIADDKRNDSIWMVNALSRYFQLSLNKGRDIVRIEEEIELTRTYIGIMQKRFEDVFEVEYTVEQAAAHCLIPKLSLQPIVENALIHGILYSEKPGKRLHICVLRDGDEVCVEISDNGNGMEEEMLQAIRGNSAAPSSYGIANVRKRLELFGAKADGFTVISSRANGTCVTLRFPAQTE